jgi:hypothetical protein
MWCKVLGCRFPDSHTTAGHKCGICGIFGHGQIECHSESRKSELIPFLRESLPNQFQCTVPGCISARNHKITAHECSVCHRFGHQCSNIDTYIQRTCPTCKAVGDVDTSFTIFGNTCVVCLDSEPCVIFKACRHANVCVKCVNQLPR